MLQDLGSDHLPILQTVPHSPLFCPVERPPSFNFQKARWDDFAFYFDSQRSSAKKYSSLSLFYAAALFTSRILNALLTIWCSGQTALFPSLLAKAALAYLPTALSVALRPPFSFEQAQVGSSFSAEACAILPALCWFGNTYKSATSLSFSYLTLVPSSPPSFLPPQTLWQELLSFSSCLRLQWVH